MFGKKPEQKLSYDKNTQIPVVRSSICTGEKVCGFKDKATGRFTEYGTVRSDQDLNGFLEKYSIAREDLKLEW